VPLAAALWHNGIAFSGTISFIFADLLSFPLLLIYKKYYGLKSAIRMALTFWGAMALAGFLIGELFTALHLEPTSRALVTSSDHFAFNLTGVLNTSALIVAVAVGVSYRRNKGKSSEFAIDPVCGMQVRKSDAPAQALVDGVNYYFCMDGCRTDYLRRLER
jgi:YHS domain-containing protein